MTYTDGMHLTANNLKELHEVASKIGLSLDDFNNGSHKHYSITPAQADLAKKHGAKTISTPEILDIKAK
jgi:hypothetical protein